MTGVLRLTASVNIIEVNFDAGALGHVQTEGKDLKGNGKEVKL